MISQYTWSHFLGSILLIIFKRKMLDRVSDIIHRYSDSLVSFGIILPSYFMYISSCTPSSTRRYAMRCLGFIFICMFDVWVSFALFYRTDCTRRSKFLMHALKLVRPFVSYDKHEHTRPTHYLLIQPSSTTLQSQYRN